MAPFAADINPDALKRAMVRRGIGVSQLAQSAGLSPSAVSHALKTGRISVASLARIVMSLRSLDEIDGLRDMELLRDADAS